MLLHLFNSFSQIITSVNVSYFIGITHIVHIEMTFMGITHIVHIEMTFHMENYSNVPNTFFILNFQ